MTPELDLFWKAGKAPFDGITLTTVEDLGVRALREILMELVDHLSALDAAVFRYQDWHEHDGFIVGSEPSSWSEIRSLLSDDQTLFEARDHDFAVSNAFHPTDLSWLLRFNIDEGDDGMDIASASCGLDLSATRGSATSALIDQTRSSRPNHTAIVEASSYFKSRYGG